MRSQISSQMSVENITGVDTATQSESLRSAYPEDVNERYDTLLTGLAEKTHERHDPYVQAMCTALVKELEEAPDFHEILLMYVAENPRDPFPVSLRKIYSSFQELVIPVPHNPKLELKREKSLLDESYPDGYDHVEPWQRLINTIKSNPFDKEAYSFRLNLIDKQLQSNILSRFAALVVAPQLFSVTQPNVYSGGCSFGNVEKMAKLYREADATLPHYSFGELVGNQKRKTWFMPSEHKTAAFMNLLNNPDYRLGQVLGVDLDPPKDPLTASYAYSNCFRAPEYKDETYRQMTARLLFEQPEGMRVISGDYTAPTHIESVRRQAPDWFSLPNRWVQFVSTQYQLTPKEQAAANASARELAGDDGYIVHMDFAERTKTNTLRYPNRWPNWSYNLFVTPPGGEPLHIFRMRNGRALDIAPGEDLPDLKFGIMQ